MSGETQRERREAGRADVRREAGQADVRRDERREAGWEVT